MKTGERMDTVFRKAFEITEKEGNVLGEREVKVIIVEGDHYYTYQSSGWMNVSEPENAQFYGPLDYQTANEARLRAGEVRPTGHKKSPFRLFGGRSKAVNKKANKEAKEPISTQRSLVIQNGEACLDSSNSWNRPSSSIDTSPSQHESFGGSYNAQLKKLLPLEQVLPGQKLQDNARLLPMDSRQGSLGKRIRSTIEVQSPPKRTQLQYSEIAAFKTESRTRLQSVPVFVPPPQLVISPCKESHDNIRKRI